MTKQSQQFAVYIMANAYNTVLYVGVTGGLLSRAYQHRNGLVEGFTKKYNVHKLVYFELTDNPEAAIAREKQIKAGSRQKKIELIKSTNPGFLDLFDEIAAAAGAASQ